MTLEEKRARRQQRLDHQAMMEAAADERNRFNAVAWKVLPVIHTAFGDYFVRSVNADFWYQTQASRTKSDSFSDRSFAGCNNGVWEDLLKQCGVARNPRWA